MSPEIKLDEVEKKVLEANVQLRIKDYQDLHRKQNQSLESYSKEIEFLKAEVSSIELIAQSLPEGCFKRVELEP